MRTPCSNTPHLLEAWVVQGAQVVQAKWVVQGAQVHWVLKQDLAVQVQQVAQAARVYQQ